MIKTTFFKHLHYIINRKTFFKGSALLAGTTVLSYALGLVRDRQFAQLFGASSTLDAYNAAFIVPDLILNIFVAGALSAAFIPLFTELFTRGQNDEASEFTNSVLNSGLVVVLGVGTLACVFAPWISHFIVPGFDDASRATFVNLMRILLISPILFAISNTLGGILVSHERFFWYGLSAALYNLGIIAGTFFLAPHIGIYGAGVGALIGALLHLIPRLVAAWRFISYRPHIAFNSHFRSFIRLMLPKMAGHPIEQLTFFGFTAIASTLGSGAIVILNFARNFQSAPVNIIGATFALTAFPSLSRSATERNTADFRQRTRIVALAILGTTMLAGLVIYLIRNPLIALLLGGGAFGSDAIARTAATLGVFTLSIPTESVSHLLARSFYALKNSLTPTLISIGGLAVALGTGYLFAKTWGVPGLALGFFAGSLVKIILLWFLLQREIRSRLP